MKIIIKRDDQKPKITIDFKGVYHAYAIKDAFINALLMEGFSQELINEVFNIQQDEKKQES